MHPADGRRPSAAVDHNTWRAYHTCQRTFGKHALCCAWSAPRPEAGQVAHLGHGHAVAQSLAEHAHGLVLQVVEAGGAAQRQRVYPPILAHLHTARVLPSTSCHRPDRHDCRGSCLRKDTARCTDCRPVWKACHDHQNTGSHGDRMLCRTHATHPVEVCKP